LIFQKIIKIVTIGQILRLTCSAPNSILAGGFASDPARELTALPEPLAGFKGAYI